MGLKQQRQGSQRELCQLLKVLNSLSRRSSRDSWQHSRNIPPRLVTRSRLRAVKLFLYERFQTRLSLVPAATSSQEDADGDQPAAMPCPLPAWPKAAHTLPLAMALTHFGWKTSVYGSFWEEGDQCRGELEKPESPAFSSQHSKNHPLGLRLAEKRSSC